MIRHTAFSALRLRHLFPGDHLVAYPFYREVSPEGCGFDIEYMGGLWDTEQIDGITLWFPETDRRLVGIVEVSAGPYADALPEVGEVRGFEGGFIDPGWAANADGALAALELSIRSGDGEAAVRALAAGRVRASRFPDETRNCLWFACRAPEIYHVRAVVHDTQGLLRLAIHRPDLIRANDPEGGYDLCFAGLYEEGTGDSRDTA